MSKINTLRCLVAALISLYFQHPHVSAMWSIQEAKHVLADCIENQLSSLTVQHAKPAKIYQDAFVAR